MNQEDFDKALAALNGALAGLVVSQDRLADEFDAAARIMCGLLEDLDRNFARHGRDGEPHFRLDEAA